jgi:hypothetical protein
VEERLTLPGERRKIGISAGKRLISYRKIHSVSTFWNIARILKISIIRKIFLFLLLTRSSKFVRLSRKLLNGCFVFVQLFKLMLGGERNAG